MSVTDPVTRQVHHVRTEAELLDLLNGEHETLSYAQALMVVWGGVLALIVIGAIAVWLR